MYNIQMNSVPVVPEGGGNTITPPKVVNPAKRWSFTLNNYTENDICSIVPIIKSSCGVGFFSKEVGKEGTPHLQGYIEFKTKSRPLSVFKDFKGIHWEKARGTRQQNIDYCIKDNLYETAFNRCEFFFEWGLPERLNLIVPTKQWQKDIIKIINGPRDWRQVRWYYDKIGNNQKTAFSKYLAVKHGALVLSGKAADMKYGVVRYMEKHKGNAPKVIIIDVPRVSLEFISIQGIEEVKQGLFFSGKYESDMVYYNNPHVFVFANEEPPYEKMSADRFLVTDINNVPMPPPLPKWVKPASIPVDNDIL